MPKKPMRKRRHRMGESGGKQGGMRNTRITINPAQTSNTSTGGPMHHGSMMPKPSKRKRQP